MHCARQRIRERLQPNRLTLSAPIAGLSVEHADAGADPPQRPNVRRGGAGARRAGPGSSERTPRAHRAGILIGTLPSTPKQRTTDPEHRVGPTHQTASGRSGSANQFLSVGATPVPTGFDPIEVAAYGNLMTLLLNSDEFLSRE